MKHFTQRILPKFILLFLTFFCNEVFAQFSTETGFFPIVNFSPENYGNALPQNWAIVQDKRGIMYFANNEGVLEYDGIRWKLIKVTNENPVKSLAIDQNGRIYVGSINEFGYLQPDRNGSLEYVSISKTQITDSIKFDEVWYIHPTTDGVYFQCRETIYLWNGHGLKSWKAENVFHTSFCLMNKIFIKETDRNIEILDKKGIKPLIGNLDFSDKPIFAMLPINDSCIFVVTRNHGFYELQINLSFNTYRAKAIHPEILTKISKFDFINAVEINKNTYSIGTWGSGLLIYQNGKIVQLVTRKSGLADEVINNQFVDKDNNLWLALSDGITKIEINSPLTKFNDALGVDGTIEAISRYNDKVYLATEKGLFELFPNEWIKNNSLFEQNKFKKIKTFLGGIWDLEVFNDNSNSIMLIATDNAIVQMNSNKQYQTITKCLPWVIYQSKLNKDKVYIGLDDGIKSLTRLNNQWKIDPRIPDIDEKVFSICEDASGTLWLGTKSMGLIRVSMLPESKYKVDKFDKKHGIPPNCDITTINYNGNILIGTDQGIYEKDHQKDTFYVAKHLPKVLVDGSRIITKMENDNTGKLWVITFVKDERLIELGYVDTLNSEYIWVDTPFNTVSKGDLFDLHFDSNGIVWFGGSDGVYRYDPTVKKDFKKKFASVIRLNIVGEDSTIFFGSYFDENGYVTTLQPEVLKPELKYKYNSLKFDFSAQNTEIEHPILFSYFMEGYDNKWSDWSEKGFERYTNLREGTYTFKVKAKNIYNQESDTASYEFTILPPWYRTIVAYIAYLLLLIGLIILIVTQYTKYLRAVIRAKTKEIRHQKEIVEHKNQEITDSIKYAKRIQEALLPPKTILADVGFDHFILFKPRDIVSGDFYWFRNIGDFTIIVAADCTGHGVPGAFVSMLGMAFLNEIAIELTEIKANYILNALRALVIKSLRQTGKEGESKDGMDIALYVIDKKSKKLQFSGANNPLIVIRDKEVIQIKGDRMPIGYYLVMDEFENNEFDLQKGDMLYTFSDGYEDQFGGNDGSKFKIKHLKEIMVEVCNKPMDEQKQYFDETIEKWKGSFEQIDDILLIGVRI